MNLSLFFRNNTWDTAVCGKRWPRDASIHRHSAGTCNKVWKSSHHPHQYVSLLYFRYFLAGCAISKLGFPSTLVIMAKKKKTDQQNSTNSTTVSHFFAKMFAVYSMRKNSGSRADQLIARQSDRTRESCSHWARATVTQFGECLSHSIRVAMCKQTCICNSFQCNDSIVSSNSVHARLGDIICNPESRNHTVCDNLCFHCRGLQGLPCRQTPELDVIFQFQHINHRDMQNYVAACQCQSQY